VIVTLRIADCGLRIDLGLSARDVLASIRNPQSIRNQSAIRNPQSAM